MFSFIPCIDSFVSYCHFVQRDDHYSVPMNLPAKSCFQPHSLGLYDKLDESAGAIAEWILPLVFAAGLRDVIWLRSDFSDQFESGSYQYDVGAYNESTTFSNCLIDSFHSLSESDRLRVSLKHLYYLDDPIPCIVHKDDLILPQTLSLNVSTLGELNHSLRDNEKLSSLDMGKQWSLDICLDYFICLNPFFNELEKFDEKYARLLVTLMSSLQLDSLCQALGSAQNVYKTIEEFLIQPLYGNSVDTDLFKSTIVQHTTLSNAELENTLRDLVGCMEANKSETAMIEATIKSLPYMTLPHNHSPPTLTSLFDSVRDVMSYVNAVLTSNKSYPFIITIARSSRDGFVPSTIVDNLQCEILRSIHNLICTEVALSNEDLIPNSPLFTCCPNCKCEIIYDYGDYEGLT